MKNILSEFIEIQLGKEASEYVKHQIEEGCTLSLSRYLSNILKDINRMYTFLPKDCLLNNINNFTDGLVPTLPKRLVKTSPRSYLALKIKEFLESNKKHIALFENYYVKKYDLSNSEKGDNAIFVNEEVYNYVDSNNNSIEKIEEIIKLTSALPTHIGILTSVENANFILENKKEYSKNVLQELSNNCKKIIIGAYDAESFIICEISNGVT